MPKKKQDATGSEAPDTVRQRKGNPKAAAQRFLPIAEIRNDTVILKNGGLRAILSVEALNFNLKSETEQQGIIAGYQAFINTLTFPLQVCVITESEHRSLHHPDTGNSPQTGE